MASSARHRLLSTVEGPSRGDHDTTLVAVCCFEGNGADHKSVSALADWRLWEGVSWYACSSGFAQGCLSYFALAMQSVPGYCSHLFDSREHTGVGPQAQTQ